MAAMDASSNSAQTLQAHAALNAALTARVRVDEAIRAAVSKLLAEAQVDALIQVGFTTYPGIRQALVLSHRKKPVCMMQAGLWLSLWCTNYTLDTLMGVTVLFKTCIAAELKGLLCTCSCL